MFGDMAPEAIKFLDSGAEVHAQHNNRPPARFRFQLLQNIQVNILREVGKRLLAAVAGGGDSAVKRSHYGLGQRHTGAVHSQMTSARGGRA